MSIRVLCKEVMYARDGIEEETAIENLRRLLCHTDREPDGWCIKDESGEVVCVDVWQGATLNEGETLYPVYIGSPVQPEEESDAG